MISHVTQIWLEKANGSLHDYEWLGIITKQEATLLPEVPDLLKKLNTGPGSS